MITSTVDSMLAESNPIDWSDVRPVYQKLHEDFFILTEPFGITIPQSSNRDLAHLICAIDVIDRVLDDMESSTDRRKFSNAIIEFINGKAIRFSWLPSSTELIARLHCLRNTIVRLRIQAKFAKTAERIFFHTESKRTSIHRVQMIKHLNEEWRLSGQLTVLILGNLSNPRFENFFGLCCETMTVIDMVRDAKQDYDKGQLSCRPGLMLYLQLAGSFMVRLPKLLSRFPQKIKLIRYAVSFIWQSR